MSNVTLQAKKSTDRTKVEEVYSQGNALRVDGGGGTAQTHNRYITKVGAEQSNLGHMIWTAAEGVFKVRFKAIGGAVEDRIRVVFDASPVDDFTDDTQAWNWLQIPALSEKQVNGDMATADATDTGSTNGGWTWGTGPEWGIAAGVATTAANDGVITSSATAVVGHRYSITYTIGTANLASIACGGVALADVTTGTVTEIITATTATSLFVGTALATHASATLDNVLITDLDEYASTDNEFFEFNIGDTTNGVALYSEWFYFSSPLRRADFQAVDEGAGAPATDIIAEVG